LRNSLLRDRRRHGAFRRMLKNIAGGIAFAAARRIDLLQARP